MTNAKRSRRGFLAAAGTTAGAVAFMPAGRVAAAKKAESPKKIRVGVMGVGRGSFMSYSWVDMIAATIPKPEGAAHVNFGTPFLNMEITHVWDQSNEAAHKFADPLGATVVDRYDGMVGRVDALLQGGFNEVPWQHRLAMPYLEAKIPTYLSRPFAYSLRAIDEVLETAAKYSTPLLATDMGEHFYEIEPLRERMKNIGKINGAYGTVWARDYPMHFHMQYTMLRIFGYDVEQVAVLTDNVMGNTYLQETYIFKGWENQPAFPCAIHGAPGRDFYSIAIMGADENLRTERMFTPNWREELLFNQSNQIIEMQRTFEGGQFQPFDVIRKKTEIFLTGFYSHAERGGAPVKVGTVPVDWAALPSQPGWIDESMFKKN